MVLLELWENVEGLADAGAVAVAEEDRKAARGDFVVTIEGGEATVSPWGGGNDHHAVVVGVVV